MPDDSRSHEESRPAGEADLVGGILRDQIDVRDRFYEPTLQRLAPERLPPDELIAALRDGGEPWSLPRFQGDEGTCGGQALATLIDMERMRDDGAAKYAASARMIYQMARLKERGEEDGVSLRDVIKAFYNYGVCSHTKWPYTPWPEDPGELVVLIRAESTKPIAVVANR
jgi:hypothetical protein